MKEEERILVLEEGLCVAFNHISALIERVAALEDGWEVVGEAARRGTERLQQLHHEV